MPPAVLVLKPSGIRGACPSVGALHHGHASALNRAKIKPSAQDVSRMEQAISWPGRYCLSVPCARIIQRIAFYRSRDMDMHQLARKMKHDPKTLRKRNRVGLDLIAAGLRRDKVRVF
jgi:hypothetical protein